MPFCPSASAGLLVARRSYKMESGTGPKWHDFRSNIRELLLRSRMTRRKVILERSTGACTKNCRVAKNISALEIFATVQTESALPDHCATTLKDTWPETKKHGSRSYFKKSCWKQHLYKARNGWHCVAIRLRLRRVSEGETIVFQPDCREINFVTSSILLITYNRCACVLYEIIKFKTRTRWMKIRRSLDWFECTILNQFRRYMALTQFRAAARQNSLIGLQSRRALPTK